MRTGSSDKMCETCLMIQQALGRAIDFIIHFANEHGLVGELPLHVIQLQYMKPDDSTRSTLVTESRTERSFASAYFAWRTQLDVAEPIVTLNSLCETFKNTYGVAMGKYWKQDYGTTMVFRYFDRVEKLDHDQSVAVDVVNEFRDDLTASREQIELVYYVEGLGADAPFTLCDGNVLFAPVSDQDLLNHAKRREGLPILDRFYLNSAGWTCRILKDGDKTNFDDFNNAADILDHVLNALSLTSEGNARFTLLSKRVTNTFLALGRVSGGELINSGKGGPIHLMDFDVIKFNDMLNKIVRVTTDERLKLLRLPLRRMRIASTRRSAADAFVDTVVALEGLLAHDTPALESTYRFRLRGAALLSNEFGSPQERLKLLGDMYGMRSRIVHGNDVSATLDESLGQASRVLKSIFLRYLEFSASIKPEDVIRKVDEWMVKQPCSVPINL